MEFHDRTIAKTISWRLIALIVTFGTLSKIQPHGEFMLIASINVNIIKTLFYYLHERGWLLTKWQTHIEHKKYFDTELRSLVKTITWKLIGIIITVAVIFIYSKDLSFSLRAGTIVNVINAFLYYFHERIWTSHM